MSIESIEYYDLKQEEVEGWEDNILGSPISNLYNHLDRGDVELLDGLIARAAENLWRESA